MKLVKQLRQATGARLVDCKAAVEATTGLEEAFQWLREKGASRAAKLETRTAAHGLVAARAAAGRGCLVEVNSETDFVARNAEFQRFVRDLADAALRNFASLTAPQRDAGGAALVGGDALKALDLQGTLVTDAALALSAHVGERIDVRRCALVEGALVSAYAHNGADGAGTAAGIVSLRVETSFQLRSTASTFVALGAAGHRDTDGTGCHSCGAREWPRREFGTPHTPSTRSTRHRSDDCVSSMATQLTGRSPHRSH